MPDYWVILIVLIVFLLGICLFWLSTRKWKQMGLPPGRLVYADPWFMGQAGKTFL